MLTKLKQDYDEQKLLYTQDMPYHTIAEIYKTDIKSSQLDLVCEELEPYYENESRTYSVEQLA